MTKVFYSARIFALVILPPLVATTLFGAIALLTGGERRCFAQLDIGTPGWICGRSLFDPLTFALVFLAHLLLLLPIALWACRTRVRRRSLVVLMSALGLMLGLSDGRLFWAAGIYDGVFAFLEIALPFAIWGLLTVVLVPPNTSAPAGAATG